MLYINDNVGCSFRDSIGVVVGNLILPFVNLIKCVRIRKSDSYGTIVACIPRKAMCLWHEQYVHESAAEEVIRDAICEGQELFVVLVFHQHQT